MDRNSMALACLLAAALSLAGSAAGDMRAAVTTTAGGKVVVRHGVDAAAEARQLTVVAMKKSTRLEDVVAPELIGADLVELHQRRRRILGEDANIVDSVLVGDRQGCLGPCPPRGFPFNTPSRGCNPKYGCNTGHNPPDRQK
ncbi:Os04g0357400 [Oryza sativa Japonica Group]|jgi:hypothetical protein|uniref:Os04g0357400 protein n=5 Tax=Oryza sativa TaxID=4530 RepID=B9FEM6_ORYSJ|nr:uncharacterized protein LOC107277957 [Oryza sativa Japonica Group]EEC77086.1 hypothetical protein OsI_15490 [Oryza sativa Indica Group]EEE60809.1 hypothetical protein OsJ_14408 [Oryza sativa Japonica Group]KAF2933524.1 hypothetical protein DAI22_04g089700 [Oryza sativa Japonica Group]BAS88752.1 Os04g0357400 [Oryza sativa Japonica Group]